jgi:hypothetical protein
VSLGKLLLTLCFAFIRLNYVIAEEYYLQGCNAFNPIVAHRNFVGKSVFSTGLRELQPRNATLHIHRYEDLKPNKILLMLIYRLPHLNPKNNEEPCQ